MAVPFGLPLDSNEEAYIRIEYLLKELLSLLRWVPLTGVGEQMTRQRISQINHTISCINRRIDALNPRSEVAPPPVALPVDPQVVVPADLLIVPVIPLLGAMYPRIANVRPLVVAAAAAGPQAEVVAAAAAGPRVEVAAAAAAAAAAGSQAEVAAAAAGSQAGVAAAAGPRAEFAAIRPQPFVAVGPRIARVNPRIDAVNAEVAALNMQVLNNNPPIANAINANVVAVNSRAAIINFVVAEQVANGHLQDAAAGARNAASVAGQRRGNRPAGGHHHHRRPDHLAHHRPPPEQVPDLIASCTATWSGPMPGDKSSAKNITLQVKLCPTCYYEGHRIKVLMVTKVETNSHDDEEQGSSKLKRRLMSFITPSKINSTLLTAVFMIVGWRMITRQ